MKSILLLVLITFSPLLQQQKVENKDPDVSVVRFTWAKGQQPSRMIRGAQNPGGPITTPQTAEDRDYSTRRVEMRTIDKKAASHRLDSPTAGTLTICALSLRTPVRISSGA